MGLAALQEQRERSARARPSPPVPAPVPAAQVISPPKPAPAPAADAAFCHRYIGPQVSAVRLGQLAAMPLKPTAVAVQVLMPERSTRLYRAASAATWSYGALPYTPSSLPALAPALAHESLPAQHVLLALSNHGAPAPIAPSPGLSGYQFASLAALPSLPNSADLPARQADWDFGPSVLPRVKLSLATEWEIPSAEPDTILVDSPPPAGEIVLQPAQAYAPSTNQVDFASPSPLASPGLVCAAKRPWSPAKSSFAATGLSPLSAPTVSPIALFSLPAASIVRFPALIPSCSSRPTRRRAALALASPSVYGRTFQSQEPQSAEVTHAGTTQPMSAAERSLDRARISLSDRLRIAGSLNDLLEPAAGLAPPRRISWRHEAQNIPAVRTLAVRPLPMGVAHAELVPVAPARPLPAAGPKRADRQIRLSSILRPVQIKFSPGSESVSFHLEPKVIRPRLRAQPDGARQGLNKGRKDKNQGDAAVASIKIPILRRFWIHAPADIRWVALIIPLVFFLAWYSWTPNGKALNQQGANADLAVDTSGVQNVFAAFKSRISNRAAIELSEDFRAGLSEWQGAREDWAANWSYDQAGFVRPGSLGILTPSVPLTDYNFEFMGQIENRSLNWVYRAKDTRNYYVGRLMITRNGPVPEVAFVRSVVKNGRESHRKQIVLPMNLRADTLYRVRVDVNGSDFTTSVLGQVVDTFTDSTHPQGGIGFYGGYGETGRVRWVEVSHQYDTLGRLCAMLVPYGVGSATAQAKSVSP